MTQIDEPTIQPIKSHTEILIQEAYDRGYADKSMKVEKELEMKHSPKGCTAPCHQMTPIEPTNFDSRLDEILLSHGAEEGEFTHSLKAAIKQLFLDVVGDDESEDILAIDDACSAEDRNQLRHQLRQAIQGETHER